MDAQTLSKYELFDRIESSIARMIDILKNRPRLPPPISAATPTAMSPVSTTPPTYTPISTPKSTTFGQPPAAPKPSPLRVPKTTPTRPSLPKPFASRPNPTPTLALTLCPKWNTGFTKTAWEMSITGMPQFHWSSKWYKDDSIESVAKQREWRPPWHPSRQYIETAPNVVVRLEWRPPWNSLMLHRDCQPCGQGSFKGDRMMCTSSTYIFTHETPCTKMKCVSWQLLESYAY
ncbi:hypothetical protein HanRHA438_Chr11g0526581 [Helianthus annuus]|nr:hypothetical protein HanLR1_Chr02g0051531 [Helianthus annuus]KAJ0872682.1 hypothetical protein HanRHA438_Chr11g0526581 [Helianthus annuus]